MEKSNTGRHNFKVRGAKFKRDGATLFIHRMVSAWNVLLGLVVEADMIVRVRRLLDRHMDMQLMEGYGLCAGR